jgi:hypothetical protein
MTAKEKAANLVEKFYFLFPTDGKSLAKRCAELSCNEVIHALKKNNPEYLNNTYWHPIDYWENVKAEIEGVVV